MRFVSLRLVYLLFACFSSAGAIDHPRASSSLSPQLPSPASKSSMISHSITPKTPSPSPLLPRYPPTPPTLLRRATNDNIHPIVTRIAEDTRKTLLRTDKRTGADLVDPINHEFGPEVVVGGHTNNAHESMRAALGQLIQEFSQNRRIRNQPADIPGHFRDLERIITSAPVAPSRFVLSGGPGQSLADGTAARPRGNPITKGMLDFQLEQFQQGGNGRELALLAVEIRNREIGKRALVVMNDGRLNEAAKGQKLLDIVKEVPSVSPELLRII